jgi:hypothetical protein
LAATPAITPAFIRMTMQLAERNWKGVSAI